MNTALLLSIAFVLTFVIVCTIGFLLLPPAANGKAAPRAITPRQSPAPQPPGEAIAGDGIHPTARAARVLAPSAGGWWAVLFLLALAGGLSVFPKEWLFRPVAMSLLGGAILLALPLAHRFTRPDRFRIGVFLVAFAFMSFWPMQGLAASADLPFWEWNAALHALAFFISGALLSGGLETIRRARNTPKDDSWEFL